MSRDKGRLLREAWLLAAVVMCLVPAKALAGTTTVEAETMSWPAGSGAQYGPSHAYSDSSNPGVSGYYLWSNATGSASTTTTKSLTGISVRLRSEQFGLLCQGSPQFSLKVDGVTRATWTLPASPAYSTFTIDVGALGNFSAGPGTHEVGVSLNNDRDSTTFPCDRNLYVDRISVVASQLFPDGSWARAKLASNAPLAQDQSAVAKLVDQTANGTWVNKADDWTIPVYTVGASTARVPVTHDPRWPVYFNGDLAAWNGQLGSVPIPPEAKASGPKDGTSDGEFVMVGDQAVKTDYTVQWSDREIAIYQPSTDTIWELYHLVKYNGQWAATDGGRISDVSESTQYDVQPFPSGKTHGVAATRIPLLATLPRTSEVLAGVIPHPVPLFVPHVTGPYPDGPFVAPALASDGDWMGTDGIAEGTRFRLPASVDVDALPGLTAFGRMIAKAAQDYGLIVVDKDCWPSRMDPNEPCPPPLTIVENPRPTHGTTDPYATLIPSPGQALANFPWGQLQVVAPTS